MSPATFFAALGVAVENRRPWRRAGKLARRRFAEARRRAGHDRGHSVDVHAFP